MSRVHDSRGLFLCSLLYFGNIIDSTNGIKLLPYAGNVMGCIGGKVGSAIKEFTVSWGRETCKPVPNRGSGSSHLKPFLCQSLAGPYTLDDFTSQSLRLLLQMQKRTGVRFKGLLTGLNAMVPAEHWHRCDVPGTSQVPTHHLLGPLEEAWRDLTEVKSLEE